LKLLVGVVVILLLGIAWLVRVNRLKQEAADRPDQEFEAAHKLGHELMDQKDFNGAEREFRAALKLRPNFDELRMDLGIALEAENKKREALV
jgi:Flp pilus assembly protein TadD